MKMNRMITVLSLAFAGFAIAILANVFFAGEAVPLSDEGGVGIDSSVAVTKARSDHQTVVSPNLWVPVPLDDASVSSHRLVIIDSTVPNAALLLRAFSTGSQVIRLSAQDTFATLITKLTRLTDLDAIHLISHGKPGHLMLLGKTISSDTLQMPNALIAAFKHALKPGGDLLLYGCRIGQGQQGADFLALLAQLTQANIAASIDNTGGVQQGGNWILERQFGKINTARLFNSNALLLANYPAVLGQQVVKYGNIGSAIVDDVTMTVNISPAVDLTIDWGTGTQGSNVYTDSRVQQLTALGGAVGPVDVDDTFYNNRTGGLQLTATGNFSLDALELFRRGAANGNTEDFTLIGFDHGSQVVSDTLTWVITGSYAAETFTRGSGTWAANPAWQSVDKVVIVWPTEVAGNTTGIQGTAGYQEIAISSVTISDFVAATNTAPALDLNGAGAGNDHTISFSTSTVSIAPDATVTDSDGDTMSTITVTMASRPDGSAEGLNVTAAAKNALGGVSGQSDSVLQNTISMTGASATTAQVATFLQSITYNNTAGSPDLSARSATVVINDGTDDSLTRTVTINVTGDITAPSGHSVALNKTTYNATQASSVSFQFASGEVGATYSYSLTSTGGGSAVTGTGTLATAVDTVSSLNVTGLNNGTLTLSVVVTDAAGNAATAVTDTATLDKTSPTVVITTADSVLKMGDTPAITFTLSEASSDFGAEDVVVTGGGLSSFSGSGSLYTATFTPTADSTTAATMDVAAGSFTDAAGNNNTVATQLNITVDTALPSVTLSSNKTQLKASETATITATLSEASSDFTVGDIVVAGGNLSGFSGSGSLYTATFTPTAGSTAAATMDVAAGRFTDAAGNNNLVAIQLTISVDTVYPSVTLSSNETQLKAGETATITATLSEASSDFTVGDIVVAGGSLSGFSGSGSLYTATFTPSADSTTAATIDVAAGRFTDAAGNSNTVATQLNITVDTVLPSVTLSSDKTQLKVGETATITATLSEASSDFTVGDIVVAGGALSGFSGSGSLYTATFTPTAGSTAAATMDVAAGRFTDAAGNNNTVAIQLNMTVDTVLPSVTLSSNTAQLKAGETATITATLSEASSDFTVGDIVVAGGSLSGFSGSGSLYTATFTPTAGSTAAATMDVAAGRFTDAAGNSNTVATQLNITVDTVLPSVTLSSDKTQLKVGETATITATLSEASSDFTVGDIVVAGGALSGFSGSGSLYTATFTPSADSTTAATIDVAAGRFTDAAGNSNTVAIQLNMTVDTVLPSVTLSSNTAQLKAGETATITVTLSDVSTDFTASDISVTGGTLSGFAGSGTSYTVTLTPTTDGQINVSVAADTFADASGNLNTASEIQHIQYDGTSPYITALAPADNSISVANDASLAITFNETMVAGSGNISIFDSADDSLLEAIAVGDAKITIASQVVTINPAATFTPTHGYYVLIGNSALEDGGGNTFSGLAAKDAYNFTINNLVPHVSDDTVSIAEDNQVAIAVLGNDSDDDSPINLASVTVDSQPLHGITRVNTGTGVVNYTPNLNYVGSDSFTYTVEDIYGGGSASATVTLTVTSVADDPVAVNDEAETAEDTPLPIDVVANDTDPDIGDTLDTTQIVVTSPTHGSAVVASGIVNYTPSLHFSGTDTFTYTVEDSTGRVSNRATVTINVSGVNDAPVGVADSATTDEDHAVNINVVANDTDTDGTVDATSVQIVGVPAHGSVSVNASGVVTFTPEADYNGGDSFTYIVEDDLHASSAETTVTVTINSLNDAPVARDDTATLQADITHRINVLGNDSDIDGTLNLSSVSIVATPTQGIATVIASGVIEYTPNTHLSGEDTFTYTVADNSGAVSNVATVTLTNDAVNNLPVANDDEASTEEDQPVSLNLTTNDSDVDGSLETTSLAIGVTPNLGAVTVSGDGTMTYTPQANVSGLDSFTYTVSDNEGGVSNQATVRITIRAVNDAPALTGNPATSVVQGQLYQFTPSASDIEGDPLTFSVTGLPVWMSFNTSTGALSGTPSQSDVSTFSNIIITVSDGQTSSALAAFSITVSATGNAGGDSGDDSGDNTGGNTGSTNHTPSGTSMTLSVNEDHSVAVMPQLTDADNDTLTVSVTQSPTNGALVASGSGWVYTPNADFSGSDRFAYQVSDGQAVSPTYTVSLRVSAVNDHPDAVNDQFSFSFSATGVGQYMLDVLSNDRDVDDTDLVLKWVTSDKGSVSIQNGQVQLTYNQIGTVNLQYQVSDSEGAIDMAQVVVVIESGSLDEPTITPPADVEVKATGLFTKVNVGTAIATDSNGQLLAVSLVNHTTFFAPGRTTLFWQAQDSQGNVAQASQTVLVHPMVSIGKDSETTEGTSHSVSVYLDGEAPSYPVVVPYTVSGSADQRDHSLRDGQIVINSGTEGSIDFTVNNDDEVEGDETMTVTLGSALHLGNKSQYTLNIYERNVAPQVTVSVEQNGETRALIERVDQMVVLTAQVSDPNGEDTHQYEWIVNDVAISQLGQADGNQYRFSPATLTPGIYTLALTVTDSGQDPLAVTKHIYLDLVDHLATLGDEDTDGDLIPDNQEGFSDSDGDGIPNYQDAITECNVIQEQAEVSHHFLVEGDPGVCLHKGVTMSGNRTGGVQLFDDEVVAHLSQDDDAENIGGVFDFVAYGLPQIGQTFRVVLPQRLPVPANAVYRKFKTTTGWTDFAQDTNNRLASAMGEEGYCPPPGDTSWSPGLTEGHWCVQLTIEDGGPNDDDGAADGSVTDPGGVAIRLSTNTLPIALSDTVTMASNTQMTIDALANDTDADDDSLTITHASADFGTVSVTDNGVTDNSVTDNQLVYIAPDAFIGVATINYSITDSHGGTAVAEVSVDVINNHMPIAIDDISETDDMTAVVVSVLTNDRDDDGDAISVISAVATQGTVTIHDAQTLVYVPKQGFEGIDTITYVVCDAYHLEDTGEVTITVRRADAVESSGSGGGALGIISMLFLLFVGFLRMNHVRFDLFCLEIWRRFG